MTCLCGHATEAHFATGQACVQCRCGEFREDRTGTLFGEEP